MWKSCEYKIFFPRKHFFFPLKYLMKKKCMQGRRKIVYMNVGNIQEYYVKIMSFPKNIVSSSSLSRFCTTSTKDF
jgi:hypothetical protein